MSQVAVVTGASSGIGEAIVKTLLKNDYNLLGNGRTINSTFTPQSNLILNSEDLLIPETAQNLLNMVLQQWQRCDILFVNAGTIESANIETIDIDKMCKMVRLKVEMSYRIIYTFLKYFKQINRGHIIITSSVMGTKTRENSGAYAGCNFALEALAESLRMELSETNIQITCIEPGLVETKLHREWPIQPNELLNISDKLSPQDIADSILEILKKPAHIRIPKYMILPKGHKI
ncbi:SDR family oxidoreductase [Orbus sturtevantii]|uniref:SDR family oxidoreductase n=1 Tax=Orbus sturtevantii TaxID=3074109 RepID=UPI00370D5DC0